MEILMTKAGQQAVVDTHNKIRDILQGHGNEEWGDCIIDDICLTFGYPTTTDIADDEGNLFLTKG